jgi:hypothetical protein
MAVDLSLDISGIADLKLMKKAGSTDNLHLIAQLDYGSNEYSATRYYLRAGTRLEKDIVKSVSETSTEESSRLEDFLNWGIENYPARRYVIDIWNYENGLQDRGLINSEFFPPFHSKAFTEKVTSDREFAYGTSTNDFLNYIEFAETLRKTSDRLKMLGNRLEILRMGACPISLAEASYQLRDSADLFVVATEAGRRSSWPYDKVLTRLISDPEFAPEDLAVSMATEQIDSQVEPDYPAQAACDLHLAEYLVPPMMNLVQWLMARLREEWRIRTAVVYARSESLLRGSLDRVDLYHFCHLLQANCESEEIKAACLNVMEAINHRGYVLSSSGLGSRKGLSIYFPKQNVSPVFPELDFAQATRWNEFLQVYQNKTRIDVRAVREKFEIEPDSPSVPLREPEPVLLGASAPQAIAPGSEFTARFAAYVKAVEQEVETRLQELSPRAKTHLGIKSCLWQEGTIVRVSLSGEHVLITPSEEEFIWQGDSNLIEFDVNVPSNAPETLTVLKFDVSIGGVIVAKLRPALEINSKAVAGALKSVQTEPARTAFASYASEDRARVLDRISEITRNGVDVFMDCMSLHPGEEWKPRLEREIKERDLFILFWSSYAKSSKWVKWEWKTALKQKGLSGIDPHPLEPVSKASNPPKELKDLHFGDLYMAVRKGYEN